MPPRNRPHIVIPGRPGVEPYTPRPRKIDPRRPPQVPDRAGHARGLADALRLTAAEAQRRRAEAPFAVRGAKDGFYVEVDSFPGVRLKIESLEHRGKGIEVVSVSEAGTADAPQQRAVVFVPDGMVGHFEKRFGEYATADTKDGRPRHADLVNAISALRAATLRALWTDDADLFPQDGEAVWWEIWLRRTDGEEFHRLARFAEVAGIELGEQQLGFPDRLVTLARATSQQLAGSIEVLDSIAELRRVKETPAFFVGLSPADQAGWGDDLTGRAQAPDPDAPAVCVLDSGVNRAHPLLAVPLAPSDVHTCVAAWQTTDDLGHGTEMAGLAQYGDMTSVLAANGPVRLVHRLESVKILPPVGENPPELYGTRTAEAASRVEVQEPGRRRCFSLAVTHPTGRDRGRPTSWSAAVDALAAGRSFVPLTSGLEYTDPQGAGHPRLYLISAGNMPAIDPALDHLAASDAEPVQDPGQAWNSVTVGAHTELGVVRDPTHAGWRAMAAPGELSPYSTTSLVFDRKWPVKPDVVFEGGNVGISPDATAADTGVPSLSVLTTCWRPHERTFTTSSMTSAATAQVAHMAGLILAAYPDLWPETVRALLVHSAEWTPRMSGLFSAAGGLREREVLLRRYGHGVPSADRALRSAANALTLIYQGNIGPFEDGKMREMHLHQLPWPQTILQDLQAEPVRLRVTLSYFVEPNPASRGWKGRYRYASHGLRFEVKRPAEGVRDFRRRLNQKARAEEEGLPALGAGADPGWFLGEQTRSKGSLHQDSWRGTAADLAARGVIGVFPVSGWWKDQPARDRSGYGARYALVVSIETEREDVDIWTPVATQVGLPIQIVL